MRKYLLLLAMLLPSFAFAIGEQYGRITGIVYDETGDELPGAKLVLKSKALIGGTRSIISNDDGSFTFNTLASGSYELTATNPQMKTYLQSGITVSIGKTVSLYIAMEVGDPTSITAVGKPPVVDIETHRELGCPKPEGCSFSGCLECWGFKQTFSSQWTTDEKKGREDLQKLPKQGQSLEEFVALLPAMQEAKDSLLYAAQPVQVVEDGFLLPLSRKARR